jgi:hypothetical protein
VLSREDQKALSSEATLSPIWRPGQCHDGELPVMLSSEASLQPSGHVQDPLNNLEAEAIPDPAPTGSNMSRDEGTAGHNGNDLANIIQRKHQRGSHAGRAAACSSYADTTPLDTRHLSPAHSAWRAEAR